MTPAEPYYLARAASYRSGTCWGSAAGPDLPVVGILPRLPRRKWSKYFVC